MNLEELRLLPKWKECGKTPDQRGTDYVFQIIH